MRRLLVPFLLLAGCQSRPPEQPAPASVNQYVAVTIVRAGIKPIEIPATQPITPQSNGEALRRALTGTAQTGDLVQLRKDTYDTGSTAILAIPDVIIEGAGIDQTILRGEVVSDNVGTNFQLHNSTLRDLTLINDCGVFDSNGNLLPHEDGRCVGFDNGTQFDARPGPYKAALLRCKCRCRDWAIYNWSPDNTLLVEDCIIETGRVGVACENSGNGQDVTITNCRIVGDGALSRSEGATSNRDTGGVFGIIARGGHIRVTGCTMDLRGWPGVSGHSYTPRVAGITSMGGAGDVPGYETVEVYDLRCTIAPAGSDPARCFDLDIKQDYVQRALRVNWGNCWGGAPDGGLSRSW